MKKIERVKKVLFHLYDLKLKNIKLKEKALKENKIGDFNYYTFLIEGIAESIKILEEEFYNELSTAKQ